MRGHLPGRRDKRLKASRVAYHAQLVPGQVLEQRQQVVGAAVLRDEFNHLQEPVRRGVSGSRAGKEDAARPQESVHVSVEPHEFVTLQELTKSRT